MNPPHHHHPMGQLPIGMVGPHGTAIGIGIPIMASGPLPIPQQFLQQQMPTSASVPLVVSPDSSDDGISHGHMQPQSPQSSIGPMTLSSGFHGHGNPSTSCTSLPWPPPGSILQQVPGMGYHPMMGIMGPAPQSLTEQSNMLYGVNLIRSPPQNNQPMPIHASSNQEISIQLSPPISVQAGHGSNRQNSPGIANALKQTDSTSGEASKKEIMHFKTCTLFPPNPSAPCPTTREKPLGCRTIFVGGLPENMTEDMVSEVFQKCGEITTIRMSKKNFCHIRFECENFVEKAIFLSGYRIRIGSNSDAPNIGRFHVDYAHARDDQFEWECRQRQLLREQRHRDRIEQERLLPPSPPPVVHYSEHECLVLSERIKAEDSFMRAVQILNTWLERGDCNKKNAATFYSMIQSTNAHLRRLLTEKAQYDEELRKANELARQRVQGILIQFNQIENVFTSCSHKKVWDHFTKAQRKNIDSWKTQAKDIKSLQLGEVLKERTDEEMDLSDSEDETDSLHPHKKMRTNEDDAKAQLNQLKEENDSLRCQLLACKNEVALVKADLKSELDAKEEQIHLMQRQIRGRNDCSPDRSIVSPTPTNEIGSQEGGSGFISNKCDSSTNNPLRITVNVPSDHPPDSRSNSPDESESSITISFNEARLIGIISSFLHVHPFGASLDYIWSYTQKIFPSVSSCQIQDLLMKFPNLYRHQTSGIGATLERKWIYLGLSNNINAL